VRIEFHPAVPGELEEIRNYYDQASPGLGQAFVDEFEKQVLSIHAMPTRWMAVRDDLRRALMRRFPYVIFFRVIDASTLRITLVRHSRRHPSFGSDRS